MRLVVVGGPGEVEAEVTHEVAPSPELDQLVAADLDVARAHEAAIERGHAGGRAPIVIPVDVLDKDQAREVLSGSDLLSEPSERQCRVIEEAGITAISGPGASPGLSNPEVGTLTLHFPALRVCAVRGGYRPALTDNMVALERYRLLDTGTRETTTSATWGRFGGQRRLRALIALPSRGVIGARAGDPLRRIYVAGHPPEWGQPGVARMTEIAAAVGTRLLARHGRTARSFCGPGGAVRPPRVLRRGWIRYSVV